MTSIFAEPISCRAEQLEALVQRRIAGRVRDFRMILSDTGVILQGRAPTYHAKQIAQHAVMDLVELPILSNDIEVR